MTKVLFIVLTVLISASALAKPSQADLQFYRELTNKIRSEATFKVPMPDGRDMLYDYKFEWGDAIYPEPIVSDIDVGYDRPGKFWRSFFDRIWLKDGSYVKLAGEQVPLTCVFVSGQDNRYSGNNSPLFPQFIMRIYVVANDYTCKGPLRPGWPETGGRKENWDTYVHYEVRDPTIMLPVETGLRYRWNEFTSILVK